MSRVFTVQSIFDGVVTYEVLDRLPTEQFPRVRITAHGKECILALALKVQPYVVEPDYSPDRLDGARFWYGAPEEVREELRKLTTGDLILGLEHVPTSKFTPPDAPYPKVEVPPRKHRRR